MVLGLSGGGAALARSLATVSREDYTRAVAASKDTRLKLEVWTDRLRNAGAGQMAADKARQDYVASREALSGSAALKDAGARQLFDDYQASTTAFEKNVNAGAANSQAATGRPVNELAALQAYLEQRLR